ncbi:MAG: GGDEF domain-containing protein [Thermoanaerobaculia bacterium]
MRRLVALFTGVATYVLFAMAIDWLYRSEPGGMVALATCSTEAATSTSPPMPPTAEAAEASDGSKQPDSPLRDAADPAHTSAAAEPADVAPFYRRLKAPESVRLCGSFAGVPDLLVLPRLSGNALTVRIDGERRLSLGSASRPASFWMQPQLIPLVDLRPLGAAAKHTVEVELYGLYDVGVRLPAYVTAWNRGGVRAGVLVWLTSDLIAVAAGLSLGVSILLLFYGLQQHRQRFEAILFGVAALAAVLYVPDFLPSAGNLGADLFLLRRKLSLAGSFVFGSTLAWGLELSTRARWRIGPYAAGVAALLAIAALASPTQVELKTLSTFGSALFLPLAAYATFLAARFLEPRFAWLWVFFGASTVHLTLNLLTDSSYLFLFHYGMLAAAVGGGVRLTTQLAAIARELGRATNAALTDPLTGARNRAFCDNLSLGPHDALALVDLDDFKLVNDRHGHQRGDRLLIDFARAARHRLRGTDHVVRLGGDEFLLVLKAATLPTARRVVEEVFETWCESAADLEPKASYGVVQVGDQPFNRAVAAADAAMYASKGMQPPAASSASRAVPEIDEKKVDLNRP